MVKGLIGLGLILAISLTACPTPVTNTPTYTGTLSGANEVPPNTTTGTGTVTATLNGGTMTLTGTYSGLTGAATVVHIHGPTAVGTNLNPPFCNLVANESATFGTGTITAANASCSTTTWSAANIADLDAGKFYVNLHTAANTGGELRAQLIKK